MLHDPSRRFSASQSTCDPLENSKHDIPQQKYVEVLCIHNTKGVGRGFFLHHHSWFVDPRILTTGAVGGQLLICDLTEESTTRMKGM